MLDYTTLILISTGSILLLTAVVLMPVVMYLLCAVIKPVKIPKEPDVKAVTCTDPTKDEIIVEDATTSESCALLQYCNECSKYADYDPPPCFCDVGEKP